jgi:hypothetical protein
MQFRTPVMPFSGASISVVRERIRIVGQSADSAA